MGEKRIAHSGPCPDDSTLAAFLEGRLGWRERKGFEKHVSECGDCREVLACSMRLPDSEGDAPRAAQPAFRGFLLGRRAAALSAATALVALGVGYLIFRGTVAPRPADAPVQTAELKQPAAHEWPSGREPALSKPAGSPDRPTGKGGAASMKDVALNRAPAAARGVAPGAPPAPPPAPPAALTAETSGRVEVALESPTQVSFNLLPAAPPPPARPSAEAAGSGKELAAAPMENRAGMRERPAALVAFKAAALPADEDERSAQDLLRRFRPDAAATLPAKEVSGRRFTLFGKCWIDAESAAHASQALSRLAPSAPLAEEIRAALPGLEGLGEEGAQAILRWRERNWLIALPLSDRKGPDPAPPPKP